MNNVEKTFDIVVVGAGVVGAALARELLDRGYKRIAVIDKESVPAFHTSGRNSGVIHSGINPKPGSLKAKFCVDGNRRLKEFCRKNHLPMEECGTVVVASRQDEIASLEELLRRGQENGVPGLKIVDEKGLHQLEPNAVGIAALHAPSGAIASGKEVTSRLCTEATQKGAEFYFDQEILGIEPQGNRIRLRTRNIQFLCSLFFNCAGLHADQLAQKMGVGGEYRIIPFRGEYFRIRPEKRNLVRSMVYPVPDLRYPFLGVHWTKTVEGDLKIGPNAIIALGREAYTRWQINIKDVGGMIFSSHFWNMIKDDEFKKTARNQIAVSLSMNRFVREAQKLVPGVISSDFEPWKSGIRAQLVKKSGELVEDIVVEKKDNAIHVLNAVSPGFTCSLPFADYLASQI